MDQKSVSMLDRRAFLAGCGSSLVTLAAHARPMAENDPLRSALLRGTIPAGEFGIQPGASDEQSKAFSAMLANASHSDTPIFLPPGTYVLSNVLLPPRTRLVGVSGATRMVYGGSGHFITADHAELVELAGIVFDGANRPLEEPAGALLDFRNTRQVAIVDCQVLGSEKSGIALERSGGRIELSTISGVRDAAIYAVESTGLMVRSNRISDCGNGGILVHRWQAGEDGSMILENRITQISARGGGTGQNGNGINVFRGDGVVVANNSVTDCAFSAIRANSASDIRISGNSCRKCGETAIYSEFSFEGALVTGNLVEDAANGISMVNFDVGGRLGTCGGNIVRKLRSNGPYVPEEPGFGIGISLEADIAATGNVVEDAALYGMLIGWGPFLRNVVATGNLIRKAGTGIAVSVVDGAGSALIADNVIAETPHGGIVGYRWARAATGDLSVTNSENLGNLTISRNRVI